MEWLYNPWIWGAAGSIAMVWVLWSRRYIRARPVEQEEDRRLQTFKEACRLSKDAIFVIEDKRIIFANPAAEELGEIRAPATLKKSAEHLIFYDPEEKREFDLEGLLRYHTLRKESASTRFKTLELGKERHLQAEVEIRTPPPPDSDKSAPRYHVLSIHDISCKKQLSDLRHIHVLSGLPNQFKAYSDIATLTAKIGQRERIAIVVIELDNASKLRSMLGYAEIDTIISNIATSLREMADISGVRVYHLYYVTFMILIERPSSPEEIQGMIEQFLRRVQEGYSLLRDRQKITLSAGVSLYPEQGSLYHLINSAFGALTEAQEKGDGYIIFATRKTGHQVDHDILLNTEIEKGIKNREFKLYFQPLYDVRKHRFSGAEVLLRWHHHSKGEISPGLFIPIAEKSGLITQISQYIIEEGFKHLSQWRSFGFPPLQLSLNLSPRDLESQDFIPNLSRLMSQYEIGKSQFKFEITEYAAMTHPTRMLQTLKEIRQLGIGISLDDFGTGYSSFAYLAELPIDTLKIDQSFVKGIVQDQSKRHIVSTICKLGHSLEMSIIAEGVESKEEADLLVSYGVDYLQGYYISRPLPQLEFQYLLSHS